MDDLTTTPNARRLSSREPEVGRYYWHAQDADAAPELFFAASMGSNYVYLQNEHRSGVRVHFRDFWTRCREAEAPEAEIARMVAGATETARATQLQIEATIQELLPPAVGDAGAALVPAGAVDCVDDYTQRLKAAKDTVLPKLYRELDDALKYVVAVEKFRHAGLRARLDEHDVRKKLQHQIDHMVLYAGVEESVHQIRDGRAALVTEPLHIMQRMHFMDEECLLAVLEGGLRANKISLFDAWVARDKNFARIFPHQRCLVAFRVRREAVPDKDFSTLREFLLELSAREQDEKTFLYFRNGEQLWSLHTSIEFEEQLFTDGLDPIFGATQLWYRRDGWHHSGKIADDGVVTAARLAEIREEDEAAREKFVRDTLRLNELKATCADEDELRKHARAEGIDFDWRHARELLDEQRDGETDEEYLRRNDRRIFYVRAPHRAAPRYELLSPATVDYDDVMQALQDELQKRNRFMLLLQGVLDRSMVLHPHPRVNLADPDQFEAIVRLVHDDSRAIPSGDPPDFAAYVAELRARQRRLPGPHVFFGQRQAWEAREKARVNASFRGAYAFRLQFDDGPAVVAEGKLGRAFASFHWRRETSWRAQSDTAPASIRVPLDRLFPVDAYTPGEWRRFYDDPRTRAQYMEWAPALLSAEEYHRGAPFPDPDDVDVDVDDGTDNDFDDNGEDD